MLEAVIFDMDGVIIDSEPIYHEVEMGMFKEFGLDLTDKHRHMYAGVRTVDMWVELKEKYDIPLSIEELVKIEAERVRACLKAKNAIEPVCGIRELLEKLHKNNIKIALASSSSMADIEIVLNETGLKEYFSVIVSGDHVERGKPAPDIFLHAVSKLGAEPENCIVIEDASSGVKAAKAARLKCIAYRNPNSGNQDLSEADMVVESFYDVISML
ncbi:MAG: HAD family hydrolase [Firmicutes bacterium]|nr:HAD family hydrolase [Bacillota bacterium]